MGKHRGRGNGGGLRQGSFQGPAVRGNGFEHGPYHYGEGFTPLSDEFVRRRYTAGLKSNQSASFLALSISAWAKRSLIFNVAATYLEKYFPVSRSTLQRHLDVFVAQELARLIEPSHKLEGNKYLLEPVFIWSSKWHELDGFALTRCAQCPVLGEGSHQNEATSPGSIKMKRRSHQDEATCVASVGMGSHQNEADHRSRSSDHTAQRVIATNETESGVESPSSEAGKRCPNGQDRKRHNKGDGLTAVSINVAELPSGEVRAHCEVVKSKHRKRRQMTREEQLAYAKSQREEAT
jgi:hypothetical protein